MFSVVQVKIDVKVRKIRADQFVRNFLIGCHQPPLENMSKVMTPDVCGKRQRHRRLLPGVPTCGYLCHLVTRCLAGFFLSRDEVREAGVG